MTDTSHIRIGVLTRPHGLQGGMRCRLDHPITPKIFTPSPAEVGYSPSFTRGIELIRLENGRNGEMVCYFSGVTTPEEGETLSDMALFLPREAVIFEEEFANPGIIGFRVVDQDGEEKGEVVGINRTRAHHILQIDHDGHGWMLPAIEEFITDINEAEGKILVKLIPGLYSDDDGSQNDE